VQKGPGSWLPDTAAWRWFGEPREPERAATELKLQNEEAELSSLEAKVELQRARVAALRSQL